LLIAADGVANSNIVATVGVAPPITSHKPAFAWHPRDHSHPPQPSRHAHIHRHKSTTQIEAYTELRPEWAPESSLDQAEDFEQSLARIAANPFIPLHHSASCSLEVAQFGGGSV
jgi:hypothetical protein